LAELENVARQLSDKNIADLDSLRRLLRVLVAPGASLGGARPKANFTQEDGSFWIAKFPAKDDDRDMGAWEMFEVPPINSLPRVTYN
jgi:serine/threonine-protein kinase HipA